MGLKKVTLAAGLLLLALPVMAETNLPAPDGSAPIAGADQTGNMGRPMWGRRFGWWNPQAMVEGRLAYVKTALAITDSQSDAWNAFADAARADVQDFAKMRDQMRESFQSGSALDRLQLRISMAQERLDALKKMQPAAEALYKSLTPEQQKKADAMFGGPFGRI